MKILITKCKNCDCIISGKVVENNFMPNDIFYKYELHRVDSTNNKNGFKITGCMCKEIEETHKIIKQNGSVPILQ